MTENETSSMNPSIGNYTNRNGDNSGKSAHTNNTRNRPKADIASSAFEGKTKGMDGHAYQVYAEQRKKRQFEATTKQLKVMANKVHIPCEISCSFIQRTEISHGTTANHEQISN